MVVGVEIRVCFTACHFISLPSLNMGNTLSIREKEEVRSLINRRFEKRIEAIKDKYAESFKKIEASAYRAVIRALGFQKSYEKLQRLEKSIEQLSSDVSEIESTAAKKKAAVEERLEEQDAAIQKEIQALKRKEDQLHSRASARLRRIEKDIEPSAQELGAKISLLKFKRDNIYRSMAASITGQSEEEVDNHFHHAERQFSDGIQRHVSLEMSKRMSKHPQGRRLLELEEEQTNLLDTVWLATSSKQIKSLWEKTTKVLGGKETRLQKEALAIEPVEDE